LASIAYIFYLDFFSAYSVFILFKQLSVAMSILW